MKEIRTLGALKKSAYKSRSIKEEMRRNLIEKLSNQEKVFEGIKGFDDTVIPDLERAILSRHNVLLLGLRGQAKTRIARLMTSLLDEYMPVIAQAELNDDPLNPISKQAIDIVNEQGDDTPIAWIHRSERYVEKLATPDVSIADLVGDVDPIKAATLKLPYSDERVIHFGLIPRSHRSIFVINELPDLQARIQVSLFNILQEGDIQIRGFKLRLPLDIQFVFTANPEDYTNRGSIITPLKDRIESQILTHYPTSLHIAKDITAQESNLTDAQKEQIQVSDILANILERTSFAARESDFIDEKSGVSARLSISGYENLCSSAERRMIINKEKSTAARVTDFWGVIPAITGKVELVYEGEQEGPYAVAMSLLGKAIKGEFLQYFPNPDDIEMDKTGDPYGAMRAFFEDGNTVEFGNDISTKEYQKRLDDIPGLAKLVQKHIKNVDEELYVYMELVLQGLAELKFVNREISQNKMSFNNLLSGMFDEFDDDMNDIL